MERYREDLELRRKQQEADLELRRKQQEAELKKQEVELELRRKQQEADLELRKRQEEKDNTTNSLAKSCLLNRKKFSKASSVSESGTNLSESGERNKHMSQYASIIIKNLSFFPARIANGRNVVRIRL